MPAVERVMACFTAVWGMMTNKPHAVSDLDLSADGFWESFWAIAVALPPLFVGWAAFAKLTEAETGLSRMFLFLSAGTMDIVAWLLPLAGFVLIAGKADLGDRIVHYVVAANWGNALLAWLTWPPQLLRLLAPQTGSAITSVDTALFLAALVLYWRLTNAALAKGATVATAVFVAMLAASFVITFIISSLIFPGF